MIDKKTHPKTAAKLEELRRIEVEFSRIVSTGSRCELVRMSRAVARARAEVTEAYRCESASI